MKRPLFGLVLAGGRSSRMGSDKASLPHPDGRPLARRCADLLQDAGCAEVLLSLRHDQEPPPGFESAGEETFVRDPEGGSAGPISGMVAAMKRRPEADWLIVACDLPRLDAATLRALADASGDEPFLAFRSESDGLPEPLCALYRPAALPVLEQAQRDDFRCPRKILIRNECPLLDAVSPGALDNANTPDDWKKALGS